MAKLSILLTLLTLIPLSAFAQTPAELAKIEKQIEAQRDSAQALLNKEKAAALELDALRERLIESSGILQERGKEQDELEAQLDRLEKESAVRFAALSESRKRLAMLSQLLLQFSREPPELFVLKEAAPDDHIHRTVLLRSMLPQLRDETILLAKEIDRYAILQKQTAAQKRLVTAAQQNMEWQRHGLDEMIKIRQGRLEKTVAEKEAISRQMETLSLEAKDLRQLMERVSVSSVASQTANKVQALVASTSKSKIKIPVNGKIMRNYGDKDDFGVLSEGVTLSGSAGSPIVAPQSGRVMFAGAFRGYGKVVILQHDGGQHSFLSGFSRIDADVGQKVSAGEPLGILPEKGEGKPELYFEWRQGAHPINPL